MMPEHPALDAAAVDRLRVVVARPDVAGGRYQVGELIGRGGMGAVYRARDLTLGRDVALKVLPPDAPETLHDRIRREARVLARLEHPGIVPIHDVGTLDDGRLFYVMRLVLGRRLDQFAGETAGRGDRVRVFLQLCDAVAFAHANGVIHRDLKPGNVMIGPFGEVLVLDWGTARVLDTADLRGLVSDADSARSDDAGAGAEPVTEDGTIVGTPGFMPPEQQAGRVDATDERADVFALGRILAVLVGHDTEPAPKALAAIVARATAPDSEARYPDVNALAADVRRWMDGVAVTAHRESLAERALRVARRHQAAILLITGYVLVRVAILFWRGI